MNSYTLVKTSELNALYCIFNNYESKDREFIDNVVNVLMNDYYKNPEKEGFIFKFKIPFHRSSFHANSSEDIIHTGLRNELNTKYGITILIRNDDFDGNWILNEHKVPAHIDAERFNLAKRLRNELPKKVKDSLIVLSTSTEETQYVDTYNFLMIKQYCVYLSHVYLESEKVDEIQSTN
ncbi:hypothetical protein XaC1_154 [Xanthomonas phage XaC1]|nr:hypothetical protein XaC1_154 [Xanthomonas phage XaC1]